MEDATSLDQRRAIELISRPAISLLLGYHPRANLELVVTFVSRVVREGFLVLVLDCDHTVMLDGLKGKEKERLLLSRPGNTDELIRDLGSSTELGEVGALVLNRPSSLIENSGNLERFSEKMNFWIRASKFLSIHQREHPVVILEDSRRYDQVEYKVHPALYFQSRLVLDAVEKGKKVQQYQILKTRPNKV